MSGLRPGVPDVSVVLVHYRAPKLLRSALRAVARELEELRVPHELIVVDNSGDAGLSPRDALVVQPGANLGYAGGVVEGFRVGRGTALVAMNPDVLVEPGCLRALLAELSAGAAVAGPRFFWDRSHRLMLPPGERRSLADELLRALASRSPSSAALARKRWRRHARLHWQAREPLATHDLSGALLAIHRDAWTRVGPFDDAYPLYFEETDWLIRARAQGERAVLVPSAAAVHHFDQSARREPQRDEWYAISCRRFRERHYGRLAARLLERCESARDLGAPRRASSPRKPESGGPFCLEISPRPGGFPAAGEMEVEEPASWRLPRDVREHHPHLHLHVTLCTAEGRELERFTLPDREVDHESSPLAVTSVHRGP